MDDKTILGQIHGLIDEEHALRGRLVAGEITADDEHTRLRELEESLDQCWDLLRRRRAAREVGEDPEAVAARPKDEVEGYLQ
jgi:hypothetical protein